MLAGRTQLTELATSFVCAPGVDWEDCGYDDKHRHFFRLLRRRDIDVFAIYEHMQCSEEFLGRLRQRHILTDSEYDTLLGIAKSQPEQSVLNKKLMNVINCKPSQLKESFADLLGRFESRLVHADEEALTLPGGLSYTLM